MIEFVSLKKNNIIYYNEYEEAIQRVFDSGDYILGNELREFEISFARYLGVKHCVGVNSGTDALIFAIRALGIGHGDEVIVPAGTYIATVLGIIENGATPVFVDSDKDTLLMDTGEVEEKITNRTRAILPAHLYGQSCDMTTITKLAKKYGLSVVEDCAQSHGAKWEGKVTGTEGDISCFSFYPTKPLGAFGDAGAICTDDDRLADSVRKLRNYGSKVKYHNESIGRNSRLDEMQAAILSVGLRHLDENNMKREKIASYYFKYIKNPAIKLPVTAENATHVYHIFPILVEDQNDFIDHMLRHGIRTQIHYPTPPFLAECFSEYRWGGDVIFLCILMRFIYRNTRSAFQFTVG